MRKFTLAIALLSVTPAICGEYHPVSWFVSHPAEARATLTWCQDNLGIAKQVPNCENALQALNMHSTQSFTSMFPGNDSVERWRNDPAGRSVQLATCRNIIASHMQMPAEVAAACAAAKAAN
jgi:hypothetical protein